MDVIVHTNHGFTIIATVRLDERGDSYFGTGFWKEICKFYVLKAGTKIALHIKGPGHEIYANLPDDIIRPDFVRSMFSFQLSACRLTQQYQMNCVVFKQPTVIPFSYYIPT